MKYDQSTIDNTLDQAQVLMSQGRRELAQSYYISAIAMMLRNAQEPIVNNVQLY